MAASLVSRTFVGVGNALKDAVGHVIHGDDAGTYETKAFVVYPETVMLNGEETQKFNIGLSFLNVNDRAFVRSVESNSAADKEGIQPQDCLQLAIVLGGSSRFERMSEDPKQAVKFALKCENNGRRTSFEELKNMFESCSVDGINTDVEMFENEDQAVKKEKMSFSRRIRDTTQVMVGSCAGITNSSVATEVPASPSGRADFPVVLVFRHTHKRFAGSSIPHVAMPYFRLDDECERAAVIVRRLAPTIDNKNDPDAWDEIMEGAKKLISPDKDRKKVTRKNSDDDGDEKEKKNDVEAETIRGMIQNAVGLAFIRTSKVVLGVSVHFGSGIVISRLEDGSWSAPSAIAMYGGGFGIQFGLEVADYIFILQNQEALEHFRKGTNYTIGGNMGAAFAGIGREGYAAASVGSSPTAKEDKKSVAPIVAYAKSQGLYFGVSLEGSKIFARDDINRRAYKFQTGHEFTTNDILSGSVPPPKEAEDLYATLHSVEFAHEMLNLPKPPDALRDDLPNDWYYNKCTLSRNSDPTKRFLWFSELSSMDAQEFSSFETSFKSFMYGGVSVQRISKGGQTDMCSVIDSLETRTLWLTFPAEGSLILGFLSKRTLNDDQSVYSEGISCFGWDDNTAAGSYADDITAVTSDSKSTMNSVRRRKKLKLSKKYSMALTDVISIKRSSTNAGNPNDDKKELRMVEIVGKDKKVLQFIVNSLREAELLFCGLKLLLERETIRIGQRGGIPIQELATLPANSTNMSGISIPTQNPVRDNVIHGVNLDPSASTLSGEWSESDGYSSSGIDDDDNKSHHSSNVPEGLSSWSQVPARQHLRMEASQNDQQHSSSGTSDISSEVSSPSEFFSRISTEAPQYSFGQKIETEIIGEKSVSLPFPLCRALLLDTNSPLMNKWESLRGDFNYSKTKWSFPISSPRHKDLDMPENKLLTQGSMVTGTRTTLFDRLRNGQVVRLSETIIVAVDEVGTLVITIGERTPRRGFSTKVVIRVEQESQQNCSISMKSEIIPMGKDLSDQGAVHRAFLLVVDELQTRFGLEEKGLMGVLLAIANTMPASPRKSPVQPHQSLEINGDRNINNNTIQVNSRTQRSPSKAPTSNYTPNSGSNSGSSKPSQKDLWSPSQTKDFFSSEWQSDFAGNNDFNSFSKFKEETQQRKIARPSTPSFSTINSESESKRQNDNIVSREPDDWTSRNSRQESKHFSVDPTHEMNTNTSVTIDVKPLPKIRLDLMPAPREEDEEDLSSILE